MSPPTLDELETLVWPMLAGLLILASHEPLGTQVLHRGIVFIDLAIAQLAALGSIYLAIWLPEDPSAPWGPMLAALLGSLAIDALVRRCPAQREALIGLVYVGAAALALIGISADPHGAQRLRALLTGDLLWVTPAALHGLAAATAAFLLLRWLRPDLAARDGPFHGSLAVLVSLSLPVAGVYLVFASLIAPALTAWAQGRRAAWLVALSGYAGGLALSLMLDWPAGPTIVLVLAVGALIAVGLPARHEHDSNRLN